MNGGRGRGGTLVLALACCVFCARPPRSLKHLPVSVTTRCSPPFFRHTWRALSEVQSPSALGERATISGLQLGFSVTLPNNLTFAVPLPADLLSSPPFSVSTCSGLWAHPAAPLFPLSSSDLCLKPATSATSSRKPSLSAPAQRAWGKCLHCSWGPLSLYHFSPHYHKCLSYNMSCLGGSPGIRGLASDLLLSSAWASSPAPREAWRSDVGANVQHWGVDGLKKTQPGPSRERQAPSERGQQSWLVPVRADTVTGWYIKCNRPNCGSCYFTLLHGDGGG